MLRFVPSLVLLLGIGCARPGTDSGSPEGTEDTLDGADCVDLCGERRLREESDGWCPLSWATPDGADCEATCAAWAERTDAEQQALAECIETNPLCFETLDQCLDPGIVVGR